MVILGVYTDTKIDIDIDDSMRWNGCTVDLNLDVFLE